MAIERVEIEEWLNDIKNIIIDINVSINNAQRLTENQFEFEEDIKKHGFFQHYWHQLIFIIVIQLCKILSDKPNEKRSFKALFKRLEENNQHEDDLIKLLNDIEKINPEPSISIDDIKNKIQDLKSKVDQESTKSIINKVIRARDKIYAHKDPGKDLPSFTFKQLKSLTDLASEIFNELQLFFLFKTTHLDNLSDWNINHVLFHMSELRKLDETQKPNLTPHP